VASRQRREDPATRARHSGLELVRRHPLFAPLASRVVWRQTSQDSDCPAAGWAMVTSGGHVHLHPSRRGEPQEWAWVLAHALLHLGFEHLADRHRRGWTAAAGGASGAGFDRAWNVAACLAVNRFLDHLKVGRPPAGLETRTGLEHLVATTGAETQLAETFRERGIPEGLDWCGTGGPGGDLLWTTPFRAADPYPGYGIGQGGYGGHGQVPGAAPGRRGGPPTWADLLGYGLTAAVHAAVDVAGGAAESITGGRGSRSRWRQELDWFVTNYPLLGGLAAAFKVVEDSDVARRHDISVAAISPVAGELYLNPLCGFSAGECRFVIAHELLHAGLRHDTRCGGRDPWLWNIACDYVINDWLVQMEVGDLPDGALYDRGLRGLSAEQVYDRIAADWRRYRKLATLRGVGLVDVLPGRLPGLGEPVAGVDLDEFYRRALVDGLGYHTSRGRGLLPAGLVEEIRALAQPPMPWDVELARWFDDHFPALERRRTYARASRRQSATPDIPRPGRYLPPELLEGRTFGVILDTSGSMDTRLLGKSLGAIASYAVARDVPAVRVVFCDAEAHDNGWMAPDEIASRVRVRGRGGTVLQPGIDLLEHAADFPRDGPILLITDGQCDRVRIHREHAVLTPAGARLPFTPRGPVFRLT
jgi:predicted metal-dependent peptidase